MNYLLEFCEGPLVALALAFFTVFEKYENILNMFELYFVYNETKLKRDTRLKQLYVTF